MVIEFTATNVMLGLALILFLLSVILIIARPATTGKWDVKGTAPIFVSSFLLALAAALTTSTPYVSQRVSEFWNPPDFLPAPDENVASWDKAAKKIVFTDDPPAGSKWMVQLGENGAIYEVTATGGKEIAIPDPPPFVKCYFMQKKPPKPSHSIVKATPK